MDYSIGTRGVFEFHGKHDLSAAIFWYLTLYMNNILNKITSTESVQLCQGLHTEMVSVVFGQRKSKFFINLNQQIYIQSASWMI